MANHGDRGSHEVQAPTLSDSPFKSLVGECKPCAVEMNDYHLLTHELDGHSHRMHHIAEALH